MATGRFGNDILRAQPDGFKVPAKVKAGESLGANTLVGINASSGLVEDIDPSASDYAGALVCTEDLAADASTNTKAVRELQTNLVLLCEASGLTDADLGKFVYATDEKTVTLTEGTNGKPGVGYIVEVVSATRCYVHVAPPFVAGAPA